MKIILNSLLTAFSFWSKIPVRQIPWNETNLRYALCFFPLIGIIIGCCFYCLGCITAGMSSGFRGALLAVLPILITGGIHHDGFCDVMDALASWQSREKKLQILSDSRCGAFAVIGMVCLMILYAGILGQLSRQALMICAVGFPLSRALAGIVLLTFPAAKPEGLAALCRLSCNMRVTLAVLTALAVILLAFIPPKTAGIIAAALILFILWFRYRMLQAFGGITGDTIGFFIVLCELITAIGGLL